MGDAQRWSVTYTKHVKQKRKVCHDGFLELQSSHHKVLLYDEYDKLLASRFVKREDVIQNGESLAFDSYLIDIGDECGRHKPATTMTCQENGKNIAGKSESLYNHMSENDPISVDRKPTFGRKKFRAVNLSPSQNIIRDFKKREINKYASSPSGLDMTKSSAVEWQVLYTTQVTQKAKKFHDGFLKLVVRGSQGRQVLLYDEYDKLLASRFVKKEDVIKSGESLAFDSYLVNIGDECVRHKPVITATCQEIGKNVAGKSGSLYSHKSENGPISVDRKPTFGGNKVRVINLSPSQNIIRDFKKEEMNKYAPSPRDLDMIKSSTLQWQVLYTTQVTQKAKKFHDGFLHLVVRGSQGRQSNLNFDEIYDSTTEISGSRSFRNNHTNTGDTIVMLYDTTRRLLESKFLKKNEIVSSGERLALDGHLVDIGEHEEDIKPVIDLNHQGRNYTVVGKNDTANNQAKIPINKDFSAGKPQNKTSPRKSTNLTSSSLKNDDAKLNWRTPADEPGCTGKTQKKTSPRKSNNLNGSSSKNDDGKLNWRTPADEPRRAAHDIMSILRKPMVQGKVVTMNRSLVDEHPRSYSSDVHSDVERHIKDNTQDCTGIAKDELKEKLVHDYSKKIIKSEAVEVLSDAVKCMVSEAQTPIASALVSSSNENEEHENIHEISILKEITSETTAAVTIDLSSSKLPELCDDKKGSSSRCQEGAMNEWTSHDTSDVEEKSPEHAFHKKEKEEFPSFDLGF